MSLTCEHGVHASPHAVLREERELCLRVQAEFREMPGMRLTLPQAARLFSVDLTRCERVLDALVHAGHLTNDGKVFASSRSGRRSA
jgi:hypothetical protein